MYEVRAEANFEPGITNFDMQLVWWHNYNGDYGYSYYNIYLFLHNIILTANSAEWIWDDQSKCRQEDQKQTVAGEVYEVAQLTKLQPLVVQQTADQRMI